MNCKNCKHKITDTTIYCTNCGLPTENFRKQFNIKSILKDIDDNTKKIKKERNKMANVKSIFSQPYFLALLAIIILFNFNIITEKYIINYLCLNLCLTLFLPIVLIHLFNSTKETKETKEITALKQYLRMLFFVLVMVCYFAFLKIICTGDPILNIVRFILVLWGISLSFPLPYLIFNSKENVLKLIIKGYKSSRHLRWHQFFFCLYLSGLLIFTLFYHYSFIFTAFTLEVYNNRQTKFGLL